MNEYAKLLINILNDIEQDIAEEEKQHQNCADSLTKLEVDLVVRNVMYKNNLKNTSLKNRIEDVVTNGRGYHNTLVESGNLMVNTFIPFGDDLLLEHWKFEREVDKIKPSTYSETKKQVEALVKQKDEVCMNIIYTKTIGNLLL